MALIIRDGKCITIPDEALALPPPPFNILPEIISDRQFAQGLALRAFITQGEALAWVKSGELPVKLTTLLNNLTGDDRFSAEILLAGATEFRRSHPLVNSLGAAFGQSPAQLDDLWRFCATLS